MKAIVLIFATLHQTFAADSVPRFALNQDRSFDGSPSISITFPDGYADTLVLTRYYANEEAKLSRTEDCHYIGHLEGEPEACVAMTGCPGSEDLEFTIMSEHSSRAMFKWLKEGGVELIESPLKNAKHEPTFVDREDVPDDWTDEEDDEIINPEEEAMEFKIAQMNVGSMPSSHLLTIQAAYDDSWLQKTGGHTEAKTYIHTIMPHVQALYCHVNSLGTMVKIQLQPDIKYYQGKDIHASSDMLRSLYDTTANGIGDADLMMYMAYDPPCQAPCSYTAGIAFRGVVCDRSYYNRYKQSINEWAETHAATAHTVAHELGHNLGMAHDFDSKHEGSGCDKTGVMSYGDPVNQWSTCSRSDFAAHYELNKDRWCMEASPTACDGVTLLSTTTTTTTEPTPTSMCIDNWRENDVCDGKMNEDWCAMDEYQCCLCGTACSCVKRYTYSSG